MQVLSITGLDHAKTLAVMQIANRKVRREQKKEKQVQYAERVWDTSDGSQPGKDELPAVQYDLARGFERLHGPGDAHPVGAGEKA